MAPNHPILAYYYQIILYFLVFHHLPISHQASSTSSGNGSGSVEGAVVPDGKGGFIINDSVLDDEGQDDDSFTLPPLLSNGFIDFQNQFKVGRAI